MFNFILRVALGALSFLKLFQIFLSLLLELEEILSFEIFDCPLA